MKKNKYSVHGEYTISFDFDVIAEDEDEATAAAIDLNFWESANGGIFCDEDHNIDNLCLNTDGEVDNICVDFIEEVEEEDEDDDEN